MMYKNFFFRTAVLTLLLLNGALTSAQVTIGDNKPPQSFSVLELISGDNKGLRLPQMTTVERDIMANDAFKANQFAMGLQIFNTSTFCVETWNGIAWISKCMDCEGITFPALDGSYTFCNGSKVSDLSAKTKGAVYSVASGGAPIAANTALANGGNYYIEQRVANCGNETRTAVTVTLGSCTSAPANTGRITTFINAMYDFQHQTLEAYITSTSGGIVTDYKWQVSTDNINFTDISSAPNSAFYTIPANFINSFVTNEKYKELYFRCILSNPAGSVNTDMLRIMFVRTNSNGYGIDENGVRYLTIQRGLNGITKGGTIKIALLNLGQSGTGAYIRNTPGNPNDVTHIPDDGTLNDAGDLGDFYQWGRIADGHEHIVWNKKNDVAINNSLYKANTIEPMTGNGATSDTVSRVDASHFEVSTGQVTAASAGDAFRGKFILTKTVDDWGTADNNNRDLWGGSHIGITPNRSQVPTSLSGWTAKAQANNPCPDGWRIPSRFEVWDIYRGDGNNSPSVVSTNPYDKTHSDNQNFWTYLANPQSNHTHSCMIIENSDEECVILPTGQRDYNNGRFFGQTGQIKYVRYWTSTSHSTGGSGAISCYDTAAQIATGNTGRSLGYSVRCVKE